MPEIPDVIPGQDVDATWGNIIRDRVTMRYTTQAALETSEPTPPDGALRWTDDNGALLRVGGVWEPVVVLADGTDILDTNGIDRIKLNPGGTFQIRDDLGGVNRIVVQPNSNGDIEWRDAAGNTVFRWDESTGLITGLAKFGDITLGFQDETTGRFLRVHREDDGFAAEALFGVTNDGGNPGAVVIRSTQAGNQENMYLGQDGLEAQIVDDKNTASVPNVQVNAVGLLRRSTAILAAMDAPALAALDARLAASAVLVDGTAHQDSLDLANIVNELLDRIEALEAHH